jgi:hypothetical protein
MKITQITATSAWNEVYRDVHERIYGLGEDNKIYCWNTIMAEWTLNINPETNAIYQAEIDRNTNSVA